ncbi:hypothetical protein BS47DRAFT_397056 [Hydnum rufescens UP504]|uniref:Uncharacterized protein n=1 Tax=Hydnum rufescens UP504 TaxID=1448309 RepID=A0A9P6DPR0_9AGAM|nr:hypothetical protein BS47DRAFT_397056 [Hydnum rufescens UP504]
MNSHRRTPAVANGVDSRAPSSSFSRSHAFTSLSGTSTPPRNNASAVASGTTSPALLPPSAPDRSSPPPPFSPQPPPPSAVSVNSDTMPDRALPRGRSRSSGTISELHSPPPPPPLFAGPGGYYAYPFFPQSSTPSTEVPGLRPSYSSPHLPYSYEQALHAQQQQQHYQQQMLPPYPFPYAFQMGQPPPQPQRVSPPAQPQLQPSRSRSPPLVAPSRGREYQRNHLGVARMRMD